MTRTVTLSEYLLQILNERARARGEDVELVYERPRPRIAARDGEVVNLQEHKERSGEELRT
jgi:hypothetical protein